MPGEVRLGWTPEALCGYTVLKDKQIGNSAKKKGDMPWVLGDVFEIFIQRGDRKDYWELHVTPENFQMALHLPPKEERVGLNGDAVMKNFLRSPSEFESKVWVEPAENQWRIAWKIAWSLFETTEPQKFDWKMAFCRYDYSGPESEPVLSSVCPLALPSFHRIEDWLKIQLSPISFGEK